METNLKTRMIFNEDANGILYLMDLGEENPLVLSINKETSKVGS